MMLETPCTSFKPLKLSGHLAALATFATVFVGYSSGAAWAECAPISAGADVVCGPADDNDGFAFSGPGDLGSLTVQDGVTVDNSAGGSPVAVIDIFDTSFSGLLPGVTGDVTINGSVIDTTDFAAGILVEGSVGGAFVIGSSGSVSGGLDGIAVLDSIGSFSNAGTVIGAIDGIFVVNNVGSFTNAGTITSTGGDGLSILGSLNGNFSNTGTMSGLGSNGDGVDIETGLNGDFSNTNRIEGAQDGVDVDGAITGNFINSGTIVGGVDGVDVESISGTFINSGTITGTDSGVAIEAGTVSGGFTNTGVINGDINATATGDGGVEIASTTGQVSSFTNEAAGTIIGTTGFRSEAGDESLSNTGTISGTGGTAISLGSGTDSLSLNPGLSINGFALGGAGTDTLGFGGTGTGAFDLSLIDSGAGTQQYREFEVFQVNSAVWTFSSTTTEEFVVNGGTLAGAATLGGLVVNSGGTVAPGDGLGTMNVTGNAVFNTGAIFAVDLNPDGTGDLLNVNGTTTISGSGTQLNASVDPLTAPTDETVWTVINSDGGVTGQFATVTDDLPDVDLEAVYNSNSVQLRYVPATVSDTSRKEIHPVASMAALDSSLLFVETLRRRNALSLPGQAGDLVAISASGFMPGVQPRQALPTTITAADTIDVPIEPVPSDFDPAVWLAVMGANTDVDPDGSIPGWYANETGVAVGIERDFWAGTGAPVSAGLAFGYIFTDAGTGASTADIQSWHIGAYAAGQIGRLSLSGSAAYAHHHFDFDRALTANGGTMVAKGQTSGDSVAASLEAFYDFAEVTQNTLRFGPLATLGATYLNRKSFTETSAGVLNLNVDADEVSQAVTGLGGAVGVQQDFGNMKLGLETRIQLEHVIGDTAITTASSAPIASASFATSSAPVDRNRLAIGIGATVTYNERLSGHIRYDGSFGERTTSHDASAGFTLRF